MKVFNQVNLHDDYAEEEEKGERKTDCRKIFWSLLTQENITFLRSFFHCCFSLLQFLPSIVGSKVSARLKSDKELCDDNVPSSSSNCGVGVS